MTGMKELSEMLARKRGISKKEAASIMKDVSEVLTDAIVGDGGVSIKGVFTIKQKKRAARTGKCRGVAWSAPEKRVLSISTGTELDATLNPSTPA